MDFCKQSTNKHAQKIRYSRKSEAELSTYDGEVIPCIHEKNKILFSIMTLIIVCLVPEKILPLLSCQQLRTSTHCLPPSGRWPPCSPFCLRGWRAPAGPAPNGRVAGPSAWSETCCGPQTDTLWRWRCFPRWPQLALSSGSTGIRSRCDSGWGCSPVAPTGGPAAAAGSQMLLGHARHAWALKQTGQEETTSINCKQTSPTNFCKMKQFLPQKEDQKQIIGLLGIILSLQIINSLNYRTTFPF